MLTADGCARQSRIPWQSHHCHTNVMTLVVRSVFPEGFKCDVSSSIDISNVLIFFVTKSPVKRARSLHGKNYQKEGKWFPRFRLIRCVDIPQKLVERWRWILDVTLHRNLAFCSVIPAMKYFLIGINSPTYENNSSLTFWRFLLLLSFLKRKKATDSTVGTIFDRMAEDGTAKYQLDTFFIDSNYYLVT